MINRYLSKVLLFCLMPMSLLANTGISTSLFTGKALYTVPIYTLEDPDFHLDISMRYCSEGFRPFRPSGSYGQDWTLLAGGCITRSVQGIGDDFKIIRTHDFLPYTVIDTLWGYTRAIQEGNMPDKNAVFTMNEDVYDTCGITFFPEDYTPCRRNKVDYMPDVFNFNFCGHKGKFIINNNGKATILSGDFVKVDVSHMRDRDGSLYATIGSTPSSDSQITIQTLDGYTYVFGGDSYTIEYSFFCTIREGVTQMSPAVTAWHLKRIVAPNGRTLNFSYTEGQSIYSHATTLKSLITDYDWSEQNNGDTTHIRHALHKDCLLQSITTSDSIPLTISFFSHPESFPKYDHDDYLYSVPHLQLDSIIISYNGESFKKARFSYRYYSCSMQLGHRPNCYWRYLNEIAISGIGKYNFSYNYLTFPYMISAYPYLYPQTDASYKNIVDRFGFWKTSSLQGMLSEVSLPTGGKLKFTYGNHQYGEERIFRVVGTQNVELYTQTNSNQTIGGVRIEKIETFSDDSTLVEAKTFSYNKQGTNSTSGIYYNRYELFYPSQPNMGLPIMNPDIYNMNDSHIGYSYVEQATVIGSETYKTAFSFDPGESNYSTYENIFINRNTDVNGYNDTADVCSGVLMFPPKLKLTGKLMAIDQYQGNTLIKSTLLEYNDILNNRQEMPPRETLPLGCTDTIVILATSPGHTARKLLIYPDVLERVVTHSYESGNQSMELKKEYKYDSKFRQKIINTTDSRGVRHFTKYAYPDDYIMVFQTLPDIPRMPVIFQGPVYLLNHQHRINMPLETISGYKDAQGDEYVTAGKLNLYTNRVVVLNIDSAVNYAYLEKTLELAISNPITDYQPLSYDWETPSYDSRYKLKCEYTFNAALRLTRIAPYGKTPTTYTWNGLYPEITTTGNQIYLCTHKPYVGVSSVTNPRGITTYYTYDSSGRLIEEYQIINGKKQILHTYYYHTKTE